MSSHQGNAEKTDPQAVQMEGRLLDDIVGAGSEPCSFTTSQDLINAITHYKDAIDAHGRASPEASIARAVFELPDGTMFSTYRGLTSLFSTLMVQ